MCAAQGTLLFLGLLLLLWVPLLVFSSGNPTYQVTLRAALIPMSFTYFNCRQHGMCMSDVSGMLCWPFRTSGCDFMRHGCRAHQAGKAHHRACRPAQVPDVAAFGMNVTLLAAGPARGGAFVERLSFPLFAAGERRAQAPWAGAGPLPAGLQLDYVPSQLMLLCVAQARRYPARLPCITQGKGHAPLLPASLPHVKEAEAMSETPPCKMRTLALALTRCGRTRTTTGS